MKTIITHSNSMHCDEITACTLLAIFKPADYKIIRIPHQADIPEDADYVIDIGRKYDGIKYFDHHQRDKEDPMFKYSSAGLIWEYLGLQDLYPNITKLINLIDENDVGIRKATHAELPRIIGAFNTPDIYNDDMQELAFIDAMHTLEVVIRSMVNYQDDVNSVEPYLISRYDSLSDWEQNTRTLVSDRYLPGWNTLLNGENTPELSYLMWPKGDNTTEWHAQVLQKVPTDYALHGTAFKQDQSMIFVHETGFFCCSKDKQTMIEYLERQ